MRPTPPLVWPRNARPLIEEAHVAERVGRFGGARACYERVLHDLRGAGYAPLASALLRWIARTHEADGDLEAALDCLDAAEAVAKAAGSVADVAHALNGRGILLFRRGSLEEAQTLYEQARVLAETGGDEKLVAMVDQNLGNVANVHGDHKEAHDCYLRSLQRYRDLGLDEFVGPLLTNIGRVHIDTRSWTEAERAFDIAEKSCEDSGHVTYQVLIKVSRTHLHLSRGQLKQARSACDRALVLSRTLSEDRWLGEIHKYQGMILRQMARPEHAEAALARALNEARSREELLLEAEIHKELAHLFGEQRRHREMFSCLTDAHVAFAQLRARRDLADVTREISTLERSFERIVHEWSDSIESADHYTHGHCERVADHACRLAVAAGIEERYLTWFRMGALLHDVGKVSVPASILNKPGALDDAEWQIMKQHPEQGVRLLAGIEFPWDVRAMVLHHHEHWDGGGYPDGLRGPEIPLAARVLCVADVYDALTTTRSYRAGFAPAVALEIMAGDAGHIFDPELFEAFRALVSDRLVRRRRNDGVHGHGFVRPGRWGTVDRQPPVHAVA